MHIFKFLFIMSVLLWPSLMLSMVNRVYSSSDSSESEKTSQSSDWTEYCSVDTSSSEEEAPSRKSQMCEHHTECNQWEGDQKVLARLIRQNMVSDAQTIMEFNFENSLGDPLLEHLYGKITTLMSKEIGVPLLPGGIFEIKTTKTLIVKWPAKFQSQRIAYHLGFLIPQASGARVNKQLREKFAASIKSIVHNLHILYHLTEKNRKLFVFFDQLIIDSYETIKSIKLKFYRKVTFDF